MTSREAKIRELQSRADRATAEANKLARTQGTRSASPAQPVDPAMAESIEEARQLARERLLEANPRLGEFGIESGDLQGNTLGELQASADQALRLINRAVSVQRNELFRSLGPMGHSDGAARELRPNYETMPKGEFDKLVGRIGEDF